MKKVVNAISTIGAVLMLPTLFITVFMPDEFMKLNYITLVCGVVFAYNSTKQ